MLQSLAQRSISVKLTPMQIPEAVPQADFVLEGYGERAAAIATGSGLVLHPGEIGRMVLQIQNWEAYPLRLMLQLDGNFPKEWCRIELEGREIGSEGVEVPAKSDWTGELLFWVPKTFFEDPQAISCNHKDYLKLNLQGCLSIYGDRSVNGSAQTLLQQVDFDLYVRPLSDYVSFLPILYREVDFISRFIKIFEQAFEPVVASFISMWAHLDPLTAPHALLPFLAHWVAWPVQLHWDINQQRRLIRRAMELYRWRGTRKGLRLYLHLYTGLPLDDHLPQEADKHISITEPFGQGFVLAASHLGADTVLGGGQPYHFVVRLRAAADSYIDEQLVRRIIEQEKPAFCTFELLIEPPSPSAK
jgi:phage tail-like protein